MENILFFCKDLKKFILQLFLLLYLILAGTNSYSQSMIKGRITGLSKAGIDKIYLYDFGAGKGTSIKDSCVVTDDVFEFHTGVFEPKIYSIGLEARKMMFTLWIDNNDLNISGKAEDMLIKKEKIKLQRLLSDVVSEGSPNQKLHLSFFKSILPLLITYYKQPAGLIISGNGQSPVEVKSLILDKTKEFIFTYKNLPVSAFILFYLGPHEGILTKAECSSQYSMLNKEVQESFYGMLYLKW
ncbi:DUF4369 domain-containing protein [Pedobacter hiemivivus]|nr:DUF4369 domain-containing protein [Pedobacter hiemivivus]